MNIKIYQDSCVGCGGCVQLCPKKAITMCLDADGFSYPMVNEQRCIDCGLCVKQCPVSVEKKYTPLAAYYGWNKEINIRMASSSGGIFSAFAQSILIQRGVVYGAAFDPVTQNVTYRSTDQVLLDDLRRSKYVESTVGQVFIEIRNHLVSGRKVLFCGTPCHVAGLKSFLKKRYEGLYTCDFVCGGAASPAFFKAHLQKMEKKFGASVKSINFRDKKFGWKRMLLTIEFENGQKYRKFSCFDSFFNGFVEGIIKRKACFSCAFADNHLSDVTIADYWGYRAAGVSYDKKGISMLVVNTERGKNLLHDTASQLELKKMDLGNTCYTIRPRILNKEKLKMRDAFFEMAQIIGYEKAAKQSYMKHPYFDTLLGYLHLK